MIKQPAARFSPAPPPRPQSEMPWIAKARPNSQLKIPPANNSPVDASAERARRGGNGADQAETNGRSRSRCSEHQLGPTPIC